MRLVAVNQFYAPDESATSQLLTDLCEHLAGVGDDVTVITSRGGYLGGALAPRERIRGVNVIRAFATHFGKTTMAGRLSDYLSFWCSSILEATAVRDADVLLVLTTPPMIAAAGALVALGKRIPLVTWVQDVYPEAAVKLGYLSPQNPVTLGLSALATATHGASAEIVALSDGMASRLCAQGADRARIHVSPNWCDGELVQPKPTENHPFRQAHGLSGKLVAMYSGNLGLGHDVVTFVEAARRLEKTLPQLILLFIGEGARRKEAEALAQNLKNVRFLPYQPHHALGESLSAADVHLVSLREDLEGLLVPSKLYGALAAGRPVLYVGPANCEVARVLQRDDLGRSVRPGDVEGLCDALLDLSRNRAAWEERGRRARQIFCQTYDRPVSCARFRTLLERASKEPPPLGRRARAS